MKSYLTLITTACFVLVAYAQTQQGEAGYPEAPGRRRAIGQGGAPDYSSILSAFNAGGGGGGGRPNFGAFNRGGGSGGLDLFSGAGRSGVNPLLFSGIDFSALAEMQFASQMCSGLRGGGYMGRMMCIRHLIN